MNSLVVHSLGGDRHRVTVRGHEVVVDQPVQDGGDDTGPTPVELFVASLAACVGHYARRALGTASPGATVRCTWQMAAEPPWRVTAMHLDVEVPADTPAPRLAAVRRAVSHCTVHNTITGNPRITVDVAEPGGAARPKVA